jgi:hypothetical protein
MPSTSSVLAAAGFKTLLAHAGEVLSYSIASGSATAVVNRQVVQLKHGAIVVDGKLDFSVMGVTEIEFLSAGGLTPVVGARFTDSLGLRHRVEMIARTDITWIVYCSQSA